MDSILQPPSSRFQVGRNCYARARARRVALLVDGEDYFRNFARAAERATHSIIIVAWDFNSQACLRFDGEGGRDSPARLGDFLNWLARRRRGLQIFVLDWDYPMVFGTDREFPPLYGLGWTPHRRVHIAYDNTHPMGGSHHQKIVVIDGSLAFVGGFDLTGRRWDTSDHCADEARRTHGEAVYPPFHDLMVAVDGEAAQVLAGIARERWRQATQRVLMPETGEGDPWPPELEPDATDLELAIARTFPPSADSPGVGEVEQLYLDMIAAARKSIYIENQYFTAHRIGEALAARLAEPDGPEIILVSRLLSHGWLEEHTMHVLRSRLLRALRAVDREGRFHVYYPHTDGLKAGTCIDVHSKLMIVDDEILRIGSSNLSNRSMGMDSECDVAFEARGDAGISAVIRSFRSRLLGEHLGLPAAAVEAETAARGSLFGAIEALRGPGRSLRPLEPVPEWPEPVVELALVADPEKPVSLDELVAEFNPNIPPATQGGFDFRHVVMLGLVLLALAGLWRFTPLAHYLEPARMIAWSHALAEHPWAPLAVLLAYTPATLLMFPRPLITLAAVMAFGALPGCAYALAGILLAAYLSYLAGSHLPRGAVRRLAGPRLNSVTQALRRRGLLAMTGLRLVPLMPFSMVGLVAGAIHVKLWHFLCGTLIGILPGTLAATIFGDQIRAALTTPGQIRYGLLAGVAAVLVVLFLLVRRLLVRVGRPVLHPEGSGG